VDARGFAAFSGCKLLYDYLPRRRRVLKTWICRLGGRGWGSN